MSRDWVSTGVLELEGARRQAQLFQCAPVMKVWFSRWSEILNNSVLTIGPRRRYFVAFYLKTTQSTLSGCLLVNDSDRQKTRI